MKKLFDELMKKMAEANKIAQQLETMGEMEFAALTVYPHSGKKQIQFSRKGLDYVAKIYGLEIKYCDYKDIIIADANMDDKLELSMVKEAQNETDD